MHACLISLNFGAREFFVDVLASFIASARFTPHELQEYVIPVIESEAAAARADPVTQALEAAHALAFRTGLGGFLAWPASTSPAINEIKEYARSAFAKRNFAVVGTGINDATLTKLVEKSLQPYASSNVAPPVSAPSTYHGGETRIELSTHGEPQTLFIGYGVAGKPSPDLAALAAHLSPQPSVKWSRALSPISAAIPAGASVRTILLPYSDATLFGLLVQGPDSNVVREAAKVAVRELKSAEAGLTKSEALQKAITKAKFTIASALDSRENFQSILGAKAGIFPSWKRLCSLICNMQVLEGSEATVESTLSAFDKVTAATLSKVFKGLISRGTLLNFSARTVCFYSSERKADICSSRRHGLATLRRRVWMLNFVKRSLQYQSENLMRAFFANVHPLTNERKKIPSNFYMHSNLQV
jgi:ubiquinol-cytochrome c reductase core subunit 2